MSKVAGSCGWTHPGASASWQPSGRRQSPFREVMGITTSMSFETIDGLSVDESHALFERRSREWLGMSRMAFLEAVERGDFADRTEEKPVRDLLAVLPFALAEWPHARVCKSDAHRSRARHPESIHR